MGKREKDRSPMQVDSSKEKPSRGSAVSRLYLYDDLMYAYYPAKRLPATETDVEPTFANGIRFEVSFPQRTGPS